MKKKRYALVGTGARSPMFIEPIFDAYKHCAELVAMCDKSRVRMDFQLRRIRETAPSFECPLYAPEQFERMLKETRPDTVLVCSPDSTHHDYIIRSLKSGCNVVSEKPITTDDKKCRALLRAARESDRTIRVIFNYRWTAGVTKIKELIARGEIGKVQHVAMNYSLNTDHGADYFRRWHAEMKTSGGLLVHKSTHHFDLVNWWLDSVPVTVFATGRLAFYGRENAIRRGEMKFTKYARYTGTNNYQDPFRLDLSGRAELRGLYLDAEKETGYVRDRNVFREDIDIYDTMSVLVVYRSGVTLNYSLNAFCPDEGFHVTILGNRGCIEYRERHGSHIMTGQSNQALAEEQSGNRTGAELTLTPMFKEMIHIPVSIADGSHGGGDALLQEQIFSAKPRREKLNRNAGHEQGIASAIIGIAANKSISSGCPVSIEKLISLPGDVQLLSKLI